MLSLSIANQLSVQATIRALKRDTASASTVDGAAIDVGELSGPVLLLIDAAVASAGETMTFTVEHSVDGSTNWAGVGADALVDPADATPDVFTVNSATVAVLQVLALKRDRLRRYIRVVGTAAGNGTPEYVFGAYVIGVKKYP
jgi:hypothetical protein